MPRITPCLWFDHQAEEAATFYTSIFPRSRVLQTTRYGENMPRPAGSVLTVRFELDGQELLALNGGPAFRFSEAVSFVVPCETQDEIDRYWSKLADGGEESQCGWLKDRYGLSWQIVPATLHEMISSSDPARAQRVLDAIMGMVKLDIAALRRAYDGR